MTPGTRIGSYEVVSAIGAGGMGEVYRARDTRLNRDVALKILPAAFTADADRVARFEREAQSLAALNHPNIAQIFGIEGTGDSQAIVMELVEGEDLSERIARGAIPLDEALPIARQIALALETAHEMGLVHRDLKPANIKVKPDGSVKVLDFGLAKAVAGPEGPASLSGDAANSPTLTAAAVAAGYAGPGTRMGVILGTAAYMAPEQAKGRSVDRRADVWAFGVVLFEMLTGRRAFAGDDVTEVMAAVIRDTPALEALPAGTPQSIRRLIRRCLEKDPRKRLRDMGDAGVELDEAVANPEGEYPGIATAATPVRRGSPFVVFTLAAVLLAGIAGVATWTLKPEPVVDRPIMRFTIDATANLPTNYLLPVVTISRDGRRLAYRTTDGIFIRNLDQTESRLVAKAPGSGVWFSPDAQTILFATPSGLSRVQAGGGSVQDLTAESQISGADWADDGTIVYSTVSSISRIGESGGAPKVLLKGTASEILAWPQVLPGGKYLLYTRFDGNTTSTLVRSIDEVKDDSTSDQVVLEDHGGTRYIESGHLVYGFENRLFAVPFDPDTRSVTGPAVPMVETVFVSGTSGWAQAAVSRNGTLVHISGQVQQQTQLVWVDGKGVSPAHTTPRVYSDLQLAPDGRRVALHLWDQDNDVWVLDIVRGGLMRITYTPTEEETPVWSPDGLELAYAATRTGQPRTLYRRAADGSAAAAERKVWEEAEHFHVNGWSPDGRTIFVEVRRPKTGNDIVAVDVETGKAKDLIASEFLERQARISFDGKWLAYTSNESGRDEVYVQPYPSLDRRVPVSTAGGREPVWSRDNRRLYFRSASSIMTAEVSRTAPLEFAAPRELVADKFVRTQGDAHTHFDVDAGGRLLMIEDPRAAMGPSRLQLQVVVNWTESVRRLASGGR